DAVLVAVFGMNGFAGAELDGVPCDPHILPFQAGKVHFDPMTLAVVKRVMFERLELERAAKLTVNSRQQVEVELRCDAVDIVIGSVEDIGRFDEIDANNERGAASQNVCRISQKA